MGVCAEQCLCEIRNITVDESQEIQIVVQELVTDDSRDRGPKNDGKGHKIAGTIIIIVVPGLCNPQSAKTFQYLPQCPLVSQEGPALEFREMEEPAP